MSYTVYENLDIQLAVEETFELSEKLVDTAFDLKVMCECYEPLNEEVSNEVINKIDFTSEHLVKTIKFHLDALDNLEHGKTIYKGTIKKFLEDLETVIEKYRE